MKHIGIIGYGSMGKMLLEKFAESGITPDRLFVANRTREKLEGVSDKWCLKTVWGVGYKFEVTE